MIEISLLAPWIFLLFAGVFDFGFYAYALVATQNAARVAALYTASDRDAAGDDTTACYYALSELKSLPNAKTLAPPCPTSPGAITDAFPVAVNAERIVGVDGELASQVTVTYRTVPLIPLPWMTGRLTITRTVEIRIKED